METERFEYLQGSEALPQHADPKLPLDLSHHFSRVTVARQQSAVKRFYKFFPSFPEWEIWLAVFQMRHSFHTIL
ncbi:hypothetical protein DID88_002770 [Monilinia fructigena]|uniref:Uncharacterized protein n=1 Tax=Monilinia fructigena TaxID=38457 RepID=A0A395IN24_9HELO|nr:hypothetical protein DID88_002770 [Monilinia fructigena]